MTENMHALISESSASASLQTMNLGCSQPRCLNPMEISDYGGESLHTIESTYSATELAQGRQIDADADI